MKKNIILLLLTFYCTTLWAQVPYSIATDVSLLQSFSTAQQFFTVGQTIQANFHFSEKESVYAWISYYTNGRFKNNLTATAKNVSVRPITVSYTANSSIRYRQLSIGWKHYFKGAFNEEQTWNLYGLAGFGLVLGTVGNTYNKLIDTTSYNFPQKAISGSASFKRLTVDVGLGAEMLLGTGIYLYSDVRTWLPASDYPSPYLYNNDVLRVALLSGGIRILID